MTFRTFIFLMLSYWQFNRHQNNVSLTYDEINQELISIDEINLTPSDTYIKLNGSFNLIDYYKLRSRVYNGESGYHIVAIYKDQDNIHLKFCTISDLFPDQQFEV